MAGRDGYAPVAVTPDELADAWPVAYHMAAADAWPGLRRHGLLSTSALLDLHRVPGPQRERLESRRREACARIHDPALGAAVLRDQKPTSDPALARALDDGLRPRDWYRLLNARVFLWVSPQRLRGLMRARSYRDQVQTVLRLDTRSLATTHAPRIRLATFNTGATSRRVARRGLATFTPLADFPTRRRRQIVELTLDHALPDLTTHTLDVTEHHPDGTQLPLWKPE